MQNRAFTLIELIITIVIIGIVSLSFPLIMTQTGRNIEIATQQEAILAGKTYIGTILSYPWDGNTQYIGDTAMILETDNATHASDDEFNRVAGTNLRLGNIDGAGRRRLSVNTPTAFGAFGGVVPSADMDDFNNRVENLNTVAADMDYMFRLQLTPAVSYVSDSADYANDTVNFEFRTAAALDITNIKMVAVNVVDIGAGTNVNVTLRAYSANIGEYDMSRKGLGEW
jgi:prepilin-type N-terminal cleavage/methylation domain-containing protein